MTGLEHAVLATFCLWLFYTVGRYQNNRQKIEEAIANTLDTLEKNNYIVCRTMPDGQKELQEVIEKPKGL
jgi:hypothetical protein